MLVANINGYLVKKVISSFSPNIINLKIDDFFRVKGGRGIRKYKAYHLVKKHKLLKGLIVKKKDDSKRNIIRKRRQ